MKQILAIDTSGPFAWVGLQRSDGSCIELQSSGSNSHNEELPGLASRVIKDAGISSDDLDQIGLGAGPGSFTGLRIGFAFAKGMAQALSIPIVQVSSLRAYCEMNFSDSAEKNNSVRYCVALSDARRSEFFWAAYKIEDKDYLEVISPGISKAAAIKGWVDSSGSEARFCGYPEFDVPELGQVERPASVARGIIRQVNRANIEQEQTITELASLEPHYLRAVAAKTIEERKVGI